MVAGDTINLTITTPWTLTGYTITSAIKDKNGDGTTITSFSTAVGTTTFNLVLSAADSATYLTPYINKADLVFDVKFVYAGVTTHSERCRLQVLSGVTA